MPHSPLCFGWKIKFPCDEVQCTKNGPEKIRVGCGQVLMVGIVQLKKKVGSECTNVAVIHRVCFFIGIDRMRFLGRGVADHQGVEIVGF